MNTKAAIALRVFIFMVDFDRFASRVCFGVAAFGALLAFLVAEVPA